LFVPHRTHEAKTFARQRLDQALGLAAIANRVPGGIDAARQRRIRDDPSVPNCINEIVLADDARAVAD
jgi:hypothetical protein